MRKANSFAEPVLGRGLLIACLKIQIASKEEQIVDQRFGGFIGRVRLAISNRQESRKQLLRSSGSLAYQIFPPFAVRNYRLREETSLLSS